MRNPATAHWRDSARRAKFFGIDAYATFPFLLFLLHIRLWTFIIAICTVAFFGTIEKFGFTVPVFLRWFKNFLAGDLKKAIPWWHKGNRY
jgi:intracellular multiplication protein IcmT